MNKVDNCIDINVEDFNDEENLKILYNGVKDLKEKKRNAFWVYLHIDKKYIYNENDEPKENKETQDCIKKILEVFSEYDESKKELFRSNENGYVHLFIFNRMYQNLESKP